MLEVKDLEVAYGEILALKGIRFTLREGELVTIIGANGAGKTTILRALMGLVRCRRGTISFQGEDITAAPPHRRARLGISPVPEGRRIFPDLTVGENCSWAPTSRGTGKSSPPGWKRPSSFFPSSGRGGTRWARR